MIAFAVYGFRPDTSPLDPIPMFEELSDRLSGVFRKLLGRGRLSEQDVRETLREIRRVLLEADVNLDVARSFLRAVEERAVGADLPCEQDCRRPIRRELHRRRPGPAQEPDQLLMDDLDDLLPRRDAREQVRPDRAFLDGAEERSRHIEVYVGLEEDAPDLAQGLADILLAQPAPT